MKSVRSLTALAVMSIGIVGTASANLLVNGGFEETGGAATQGWGGYTYGDCAGCTPNPDLPGWTVASGGNVDIVPEIGAWKPAYELNHALDLVGVSQGSISQSFATMFGASYTLRFHYSKNVAGSANPATATVSLAGDDFAGWSSNLSVSNDDAGVSGAMNWLAFGPYMFTGTGKLITLTFAATNAQAQGGVFVDAVSVVPEPQAYGLALAGMSVVGFAMRRKRIVSPPRQFLKFVMGSR